MEKYNQTLKAMLRKFVPNTGTDWDQWLPYLLFAYREVPQVSTGLSPFEYCCQARGPLDLLKDYWENPRPEGENIVAYVVQMRERLEQMPALVWEECNRAIRDLKEAICTQPVLHSPDFDKQFILQTDESGVGLRAVLLQEIEEEEHSPE